jgi:hypothetical protein
MLEGIKGTISSAILVGLSAIMFSRIHQKPYQDYALLD